MMKNTHPTPAKRLAKLCAALLLALTSAACGLESSGDPAVGPPAADFSQSATEGGPGLLVQFRDESSGEIDAHVWDFGAAGTSDERNPLVRFDDIGVYSVELTVTGPEGRSSLEKRRLIEIFEAEDANVASFEASARTGGPGLTVQFSNTSLGTLTSQTWDFGDAGIAPSTEENPTVVFEDVGSYTITLNVVGSAGAGVETRTNYIVVSEPEDTDFVDFEADRTSGGPGVTVQFTDTSEGTPTSWDWDFGAAGSSTEQNPTVVFDTIGDYTVTLDVDGDRGEGIETKIDYISVVDPGDSGIADFTVDTNEGVPGDTFTFTDTSTIAATSWDWEVRDGTDTVVATSTLQNPSFTLASAGFYDVQLTITSAGGQSTLDREDYIHVFGPPVASFTCSPDFLTFSPIDRTCTNTSSDAKVLEWDFGQGDQCYFVLDDTFAYAPPGGLAPCGSANPTFEFSVPEGSIDPVDDTIELTAIGPGGSDTSTLTVSTAPLYIDPNVPSGSTPPVEVRFRARTNGVPANFYAWEVNPQIGGGFGADFLDITLNRSGTYSVLLLANHQIVEEGFLNIAQATLEYVVAHAAPVAAFSSEGSIGPGPLTVQFVDESTGALSSWLWDFGDGTSCFYTEDEELEAPDGEPDCDSASPSHVYDTRGDYDVTLTVEGPENEGDTTLIESTVTSVGEVRVTIEDASFELQTHTEAIGAPWTQLRPPLPAEQDAHIALGLEDESVSDVGMPSDGVRFALLDGNGTDGVLPVAQEDNGIRQSFLLHEGRPVIQFDYTFLYLETPAGSIYDGIAASVSDGTTEVFFPTSLPDDLIADTTTPYAGPSAIFPMVDGKTLRSTPTKTGSVSREKSAVSVSLAAGLKRMWST